MELTEEIITAWAQIGEAIVLATGEDELVITNQGWIMKRWEEYIGCGDYETKEELLTPASIEALTETTKED